MDTRVDDETINERARHMAEQICRCFRAHDRQDREAALDALYAVDERQFPHLDGATTRRASEAYIDALWAKDRVENRCREARGLDVEQLVDADWGPVREAFAERAAAAGMDERYAEASTLGWYRHKVGGDYWTPLQRAQLDELRAALDAPHYPQKPRYGQSGMGVEAARYTLAVELHDMHTERHWEQAVAVMVPYYRRVLESR